jgi:hypothetical protein
MAECLMALLRWLIMTDREALEALVETWRYEYEQQAGSAGHTNMAKAFETCADELEEVLDE